LTEAHALRRAAVLGLIQGPAELLPVSSSAHLDVAERLAGWSDLHDDADSRKAFEVALHAGAAMALAFQGRRELAGAIRGMSLRRAGVTVLATLPPAVAGLAGRRLIEEELSGGRATAFGLAAGAFAMAVADRAPEERGAGETRPLDGLVLGVAQAAALVPGVSRNGATLTAARARRFTREHSARLSWGVALPIVAGALGLKAPTLIAGLRDPGQRGMLLAGTISAAASTAVAAHVVGPPGKPRRLWPFAGYRLAISALAFSLPPARGAIE
jgi:undecaprenyl-diphosphatase